MCFPPYSVPYFTIFLQMYRRSSAGSIWDNGYFALIAFVLSFFVLFMDIGFKLPFWQNLTMFILIKTIIKEHKSSCKTGQATRISSKTPNRQLGPGSDWQVGWELLITNLPKITLFYHWGLCIYMIRTHDQHKYAHISQAQVELEEVNSQVSCLCHNNPDFPRIINDHLVIHQEALAPKILDCCHIMTQIALIKSGPVDFTINCLIVSLCAINCLRWPDSVRWCAVVESMEIVAEFCGAPNLKSCHFLYQGMRITLNLQVMGVWFVLCIRLDYKAQWWRI